MHARVTDLYAARLRGGHIERDAAQEAVVRALDNVADALAEYRLATKSGALGWLFGARQRKAPPPRGLYIHGEVGRGKTMLMDLFFEAAPVERKRRVHFHAFMADVHARIHAWRQQLRAGAVKGDDPVAPVAAAIAADAHLLCFDEFAVTDIADAMILGRLFTALFGLGVVVVATSNVEPDRLYEGGLNRALFLPFIALLRQRMDVVALVARTDFRLEKLSLADMWVTPADARATERLTAIFEDLTGARKGEATSVSVMGRAVAVPQARQGVARFRFADLCEQPLGAGDYVELARTFHTILIDGIPVLGSAQRNEARRFVWLIDALYDMHVKLVASAEAEPDGLYPVQEGREAFEFERTKSRLIEMRSKDYLALPHGQGHSQGSGDTTGLVET